MWLQLLLKCFNALRGKDLCGGNFERMNRMDRIFGWKRVDRGSGAGH
jgi:hypothetical protein